MDIHVDFGSHTEGVMAMETGQGNGASVAMNVLEAPTSVGQSHSPNASEPPSSLSASTNGLDVRPSMLSFDRTVTTLPPDVIAPQSSGHLPHPFLDLASANSMPSRRTQWMPDFTFGPASEPIDIPAFLSSPQETLGLEQNLQQTGGDLRDWVRPEHVAGWRELQALGLEERMMLQETCSVSGLLTFLTDITSDPARLNLVKEMHNQSTLAALGHTVESIKLPPEKRDRKRKVSGKVGVGGSDVLNNEASEGQQDDDGPNRYAQEEASQAPGNEIGAPSAEVRGVTGGAKAGVSLSTTVPETTSGAAPVAATAHPIGGRNRKGKARVGAGETVSDPTLLELGDILGRVELHSWQPTDAAKHYIRKPRSSDVNVLAEVRPSAIPFVMPENLDHGLREHSSPSYSSLQGPAPKRSAHALIELSILTPAPHPPHTPRHTLSLALLNSQTLEDISEALVCGNRWVPRSINDSGVPSGACIVIEGTVYGDGEGDADGKDYADKVTEYLAALKAQADTPISLGKKERDAIMILDEQLKIGMPMLSTRLDSIRWKLHKPYWFMHDGGCVHWIIVSSISVLHPNDPLLPTPEKSSNWPYATALSPLPHRALCRVCSRVPAVLAVSGDSRLGESPSLVCDGCWGLLGPPKAGRDYSEGKGGLTILPLVSPDGL
ncbi:snRNA-activating protein of 50 kDa MW carboxy-terminal protein [Rhizoctonia solani 123E]|uniref:snRNA-activating protein of 50 kDa MW carboxy-terminal protein n=1 Tax=Rhizoctonia solani 123E TaxID=1423351 RepID=A0A074RI65_9AGAM|nr:snRNA-activating protein of 50 kDa MW carboxy-terminal protein [Rhizoctonia solani 123E]